MKAMTFRLSESDIELLQRIIDARGCSKADAIRFAIQSGASAIQTESRDSGGNEAATAAIAALSKQLDAKDAQIADLNARLSETTQALASAQRAVEQSHMLHAADKKEGLLLGDGRTAEEKSVDDVRRMGLLEFIRWKRRG